MSKRRAPAAANESGTNLMPREKLKAHGPGALSIAELLAIIFGTGKPGVPVVEFAGRIVRDYGAYALRDVRNLAQVQRETGLPFVKACQLLACFELGARLYKPLPRDKQAVTIRTPQDVFDLLGDMRTLRKEQLRGLYLNARNVVIHQETLSIGTITANLVDAKEIFRPAIEYGAVGVIIVHNHPSDNPEPSNEDIAVTTQMAQAGSILTVRLIDHIIIAGERFVSLNERGVV
jgi:DNA repair protein RadC